MSPWKKITVNKKGEIVSREDLGDSESKPREINVTPPGSREKVVFNQSEHRRPQDGNMGHGRVRDHNVRVINSYGAELDPEVNIDGDFSVVAPDGSVVHMIYEESGQGQSPRDRLIDVALNMIGLGHQARR